MAICTVIGAVATLFLPETLGQRLPGSLEEAKEFGKDQPFWVLPKPNIVHIPAKVDNDDDEDGVRERLNKTIYVP